MYRKISTELIRIYYYNKESARLANYIGGMERFILVPGQEMDSTLRLETYQSLGYARGQNTSPKAMVTKW